MSDRRLFLVPAHCENLDVSINMPADEAVIERHLLNRPRCG